MQKNYLECTFVFVIMLLPFWEVGFCFFSSLCLQFLNKSDSTCFVECCQQLKNICIFDVSCLELKIPIKENSK
ncbi:hypothetical protein CVS40_1905 [Lucilia cuprina]|nr:hypothetical protein CVS40_1905 [Lucilia cuprina]